MSLSDYLAKNYLQSDKDKKKRGKKDRSEKGKQRTLVVDDAVGISPREENKTRRLKDSIDSLQSETANPAVPESLRRSLDGSVASSSTPEPKGWKVVGTDEVITSRQATTSGETPVMASGARAGLQTGAEVAAQIKAKEAKEREMLEEMRRSQRESGNSEETIYRDASGRKIDMKTRIEERKRLREEEEHEKERKKRDFNMGLVQKMQLEEERRKVKDAAVSGLSKYANDRELNDKLKQQEMEEDPMMSFQPQKSKKHISLTGRKLYTKSYPENRFGITPGHRWDGVDRSNGFEKKFFKKQMEVERNKTLSYTMQEDY